MPVTLSDYEEHVWERKPVEMLQRGILLNAEKTALLAIDFMSPNAPDIVEPTAENLEKIDTYSIAVACSVADGILVQKRAACKADAVHKLRMILGWEPRKQVPPQYRAPGEPSTRIQLTPPLVRRPKDELYRLPGSQFRSKIFDLTFTPGNTTHEAVLMSRDDKTKEPFLFKAARDLIRWWAEKGDKRVTGSELIMILDGFRNDARVPGIRVFQDNFARYTKLGLVKVVKL